MLYRPVYLRGRQAPLSVPPMHTEALISVVRPPPSPPPQPPEPEIPQPPAAPVEHVEEVLEEAEQPEEFDESPENMKRLPMLIARWKIVIPPEATRDVLSGRVPYLLVENEGTTLFKPVHLFAALKLGKDRIELMEDFSCLGAHEQVLDKRTPKKRAGLGYRRKYISPELIGQGIYRVSASKSAIKAHVAGGKRGGDKPVMFYFR